MDKNQYETVVRWAESGAEAERTPLGRDRGPFANVAEGLKGFGAPAETQAQREEYLERTMYACAATAEQLAMFAQFGMADQQSKADMMTYSGIVLALELANRVAGAGLNIEIAG